MSVDPTLVDRHQTVAENLQRALEPRGQDPEFRRTHLDLGLSPVEFRLLLGQPDLGVALLGPQRDHLALVVIDLPAEAGDLLRENALLLVGLIDPAFGPVEPLLNGRRCGRLRPRRGRDHQGGHGKAEPDPRGSGNQGVEAKHSREV